MRIPQILRTVVLCASLVLGAAPAHAGNPAIKYMAKGALYGAGAGTAAGIVSYPFSHDTRTIFMGTSIGLLLGMGAGLYYGLHKDEIDSQLHSAQDTAPGLRDEPSLVKASESALLLGARSRTALVVQLPAIRF